MIKTIIACFALYQSTLGNRLLLQAVQPAPPAHYPWEIGFVPQQIAQPPVAAQPQAPPQPPALPQPPPPAVVEPQVPQPPPVSPVPPAVGAPPVQPPPAVGPPGPPVPPAAVTPPAAVGPPAQQPPPGPPAIPVPPAGVTPPAAPQWPPIAAPRAPPAFKTECKIPSGQPGSCSQPPLYAPIIIQDPRPYYELSCAVAGGCYGSTFNIDFTNHGYPSDTISLLSFVGEGAAMNAFINVNVQNGRPTVRIEEIKCDKPRACQNTRFVFGPDVEFNQGDFYCTPGSCDGATINGEPAYFYVDQI